MWKLAEMAEGPAWCDEVASDRCLFDSDLSVKRSAVHTEEETGRTRPNVALSLR